MNQFERYFDNIFLVEVIQLIHQYNNVKVVVLIIIELLTLHSVDILIDTLK